ncbi:MAG TPA: hypothetical protein VFI08_01340 [Spirochaetia bacterium]|nr:hypothetical protein [Spirochaetia bacterium]
MSEAALESAAASSRVDEEILALLAELREVFENHFDRTWFSLIIDGVPIDLRTMRDIRDIVSLTSLYPGEEWLIYRGALELETFYRTVRRFLLPVLKERLGISWLLPARRVKDARQYIVRKFVAFTFPYNLERLRRLTQRLKATLLLHYPFLE